MSVVRSPYCMHAGNCQGAVQLKTSATGPKSKFANSHCELTEETTMCIFLSIICYEVMIYVRLSEKSSHIDRSRSIVTQAQEGTG